MFSYIIYMWTIPNVFSDVYLAMFESYFQPNPADLLNPKVLLRLHDIATKCSAENDCVEGQFRNVGIEFGATIGMFEYVSYSNIEIYFTHGSCSDYYYKSIWMFCVAIGTDFRRISWDLQPAASTYVQIKYQLNKHKRIQDPIDSFNKMKLRCFVFVFYMFAFLRFNFLTFLLFYVFYVLYVFILFVF